MRAIIDAGADDGRLVADVGGADVFWHATMLITVSSDSARLVAERIDDEWEVLRIRRGV